MNQGPYKDPSSQEYKDCFEAPWACKSKYYGFSFDTSSELKCYVYTSSPINITKKVLDRTFQSTSDTFCRIVEKDDTKHSEFNDINDDLGCARFGGLYQKRFSGVVYNLNVNCRSYTENQCNNNQYCSYDSDNSRCGFRNNAQGQQLKR